jgi:hypothetical protein
VRAAATTVVGDARVLAPRDLLGLEVVDVMPGTLAAAIGWRRATSCSPSAAPIVMRAELETVMRICGGAEIEVEWGAAAEHRQASPRRATQSRRVQLLREEVCPLRASVRISI